MYTDRLVGRSDLLSSLQALFARGERLVTLIGPPGVGKTWLARAFSHGPRAPVAAALGEGTPVAWCACSAARDGDDVLRALSLALEAPLVRDDAAAQLADTLVLRGGLLLVLDHGDPALPALRAMLPALLAACDELRVLVTAREPLDVEPEARLEVGALSDVDAGALWRAVRDAPVGPDDADALRLVGHVALAVELLAADATTPPRARHDALARRARDGAAPLDGAIAAACETLDPDGAAALAEASVFEDGFTLDDAVMVLSAGASLPGILSELSARRLVRVHHEPAPRRVRFSLDEPVHAYAARELARSGVAARVLARHAQHFLARGRAWVSEALWRGSYASRVTLDREQANLAAVARRADRLHDAPADRCLTRALARLYQTPTAARSAGLGAHLDALDRELDEATAAGTPESALLGVWFARGWRHARANRHEQAVEAYERAAERALTDGRYGLVGHLYRAVASARVRAGRMGEAFTAADKARALLEHGDRLGESAWALLLMGQLLYERGAFEDAVGTLSRTLLRAKEHRNEAVEGRALLVLGEAELALGRHDASRAHLKDALAAFQRVGDHGGVATAHAVLARLLHDQGRTDASIAEFQAAVDLATRLGDAHLGATIEISLGALLHEFGHLNEARALLERATVTVAGRSVRDTGFGRAHLAAVYASSGEHEAADREILEARAAVTAPGDRLAPVIRALRVFVILCKAREYPRHEAREVAREARHELAALKALPPEECGVELRIAMRLLSGFDGDALLSPSAELVRPQSLLAHRMGLWFVPPGAPEVSLRTRTTLATLLRRLGEQRAASPGRSLSPESLIADMWPGEKIIPKAARNRLHVAVRTLRTMGLGTTLRSDMAGYHLDPTVPFRFVGDEG
jgi:tetratricopeptide (TPR) repeat protein